MLSFPPELASERFRRATVNNENRKAPPFRPFFPFYATLGGAAGVIDFANKFAGIRGEVFLFPRQHKNYLCLYRHISFLRAREGDRRFLLPSPYFSRRKQMSCRKVFV